MGKAIGGCTSWNVGSRSSRLLISCCFLLGGAAPFVHAAGVTIAPSLLSFGTQVIQTSSAAKTLTLTNGQTKALKITSIVSGLGDFTQTNSCPLSPATLAAGASCTISVTFTPAALGSRQSTLSVSDDAAGSPHKATLSGTGIAAVTTSLVSLAFGNQVVGTKSASKDVSVKNNQSVPLTITSITATPSDYATTTNCPLSPSTLAALGTCKISVSFTPATTGNRSGALNIADNASNSPTVNLSGTGTSAATLLSIAVTPSSGMVTTGNTLQLTATGTYSDGTTANLTPSATWTSSDSGVAQIAAGVVTGISNGSVSITAAQSGVTSPSASVNVGTAADFYVSTAGSDAWSGTWFMPTSDNTDGPFATVARAQTAVQSLLASGGGRTAPISVLIRGGSYYQQALSFSASDSGSATLPVIWQNYPDETPVFSGGMPITGWTNLGNNMYQVTLPAGTLNFEDLFYNGQRRLRPRLGSYLGNYYRVASPVFKAGLAPPAPAPDPNCALYVAGKGWQCFDRFKYKCGDLTDTWQNLKSPYPAGDVELLIFELWTASKLKISSIDTQSCIAYMTGPTKQQGSHGFLADHRYIVENIKDSLTQPGQWFLDRSSGTWTLTYLANAGENPASDLIVAPQSTQVLVANHLQYVTFKGITFKHDNNTVPTAGYVSQQHEPSILGAVACYNCQHVTLDSIIIAETTGTGLEMETTEVDSASAYNVLTDSALYDIGADGVRIGQRPAPSDTDANVPQFHTVQNTLIEGFGRVIPSAIGIAQGAGHDNTYTHNDIYDGYHSAIEICVPPTCSPGTSGSNGTFNIVVSFNHVYNLFQGLTDDGGAIYLSTGGASFSPTGNKVLNNRVHDTSDASIYDSDGYGAHGIYTDSSTGLVDIENNLVYRVSGFAMNITKGPQQANYANTIRNNIMAYARGGMINNGNPYTTSACPASVVTIFNASNNLFYFDRTPASPFYVQKGCEYTCGASATALHNWQSNLYWRTDGGFAADPLAFHTQPNPGSKFLCADVNYWKFYKFTDWQTLGQDAGSIVATNPGFKAPWYPEDDYSLPTGSPGVGFITFDINQMGRQHPVIKPDNPNDIPATFQTRSYDPANDY